MTWRANRLWQNIGLGVDMYWSFGQVHMDVVLAFWVVGVSLGTEKCPDPDPDDPGADYYPEQ